MEIQDSVGVDGVNDPQDVAIVQALLNAVASDQGGPDSPLSIDGAIGQRTLDAIGQFTAKQFQVCDQVISPGDFTWQRLVELTWPDTPPLEDDGIAWGARVSAEFKQAVIDMAAALDTQADYLMAVMAFESGFSPSVQNTASHATGLIQFLPSTAVGLGTSVETLKQMSAVDQLAYVQRYFAPRTGQLTEIDDVYMAVLWPTAMGQPVDTALFKRTDHDPSNYMQNQALDLDRDGVVTKAEAASRVRVMWIKGRSVGYVG